MRQTLRRARRAVDAAITDGAVSLLPATATSLRDLDLNTAGQGIRANTPAVTGATTTPTHWLNGCGTGVDQVLYFTVDVDTAWTNNPAEHAIRTAKLQAKDQRKLAQHARTGRVLSYIRSYIATAKAYGMGSFTALRDAPMGNPWAIPVMA